MATRPEADIQSHLDAIAAALASMADEHGLPNSFSCGEISAACRERLSASTIGVYLRARRTTMRDRLAARGLAIKELRRAERSYVAVTRVAGA